MIKHVAISTAMFALVISVCCSLFLSSDVFYSCLVGSGLMLVNLFSLWALWKFIFLKKNIALVVLIIIFKYLILGLILWKLSRALWINPFGLVLGLSSLLLGITCTAVFKKFLYRDKF